MTRYTICFKPAIGNFGTHDPSAVIFRDGKPVYGVEEERFTREKHAVGVFPVNSIKACLDHCDIGLNSVDEILLPYVPKLKTKTVSRNLKSAVSSGGLLNRVNEVKTTVESFVSYQLYSTSRVENRLQEIFGEEVPPIRTLAHHLCHAASAFHPSGLDNAVVLTIDGKGEYDSTVVWRGDSAGLERVQTYELPNSLGHFFGIVTEFLGYRAFNGEGKIMGLAPYGSTNEEIESNLLDVIDVGLNYDVTHLTERGIEEGVRRLETALGRDRSTDKSTFDDWEKDLAFTAQKLLEETVVEIVDHYCRTCGTNNVCLAGGVALNCKMNKRVMELDNVDEIFIQPVAHDAGLALGAGMVDQQPGDVEEMTDVYLGSGYDTAEVKQTLEKNKLDFTEPDNLERFVAEKLANGNLVGWFQGRMEMGPRALGNRSILADPRTAESRDRVNKYVKHREEWRPFAPSMVYEAASDYLQNAEEASFMIKTFDVRHENKDDITAVLHPGDDTTRPQTVREEQNERYYELLKAFEDITGVPVLLNTSFNDHGEPIVRTPTQALKDFYGMGLDVLVMNDIVVEK